MQPSRRLRFLHLTTFYPPYSFGGDAIYVRRLAHALADAGHEVDVVYCRDAYDLLHPGPPEIDFPSHPGVNRIELRTPGRWLSPVLTQLTGTPALKQRRLNEIIRAKRYDVIHFHNVSLLGLTALDCGTAQPNAVKLYTAHEYWLVCPTHMLWKLGERACERPQCFRCQIAARRPPQLWRTRRFIDRATAHVDLFLAPSRFAADMHAARGFPRSMEVLPYFTDDNDADWQTPAPRPHEPPYFLFVGRLEPPKGVHTLIDAWSHVDHADLLIVGTGSQEAELRRRASSNPRVRFLGPMSQEQLGPLYFHAIALIVPTLAYETFGIVLIEAFSRRTPVIARHLGPLPEIVRESGGGLVFRDRRELLDAIGRIASSRELCTELGDNGHRALQSSWTPQAHLKRYFEHLAAAARAKLGHVPWIESASPHDGSRPCLDRRAAPPE